MIEVKKKGRKPINTKAFERIRSLSAGSIIIKKKEWKLATPPGAHILREHLGREYLVQTLADDSGWLIKRLK